jgi:predicted transcriptional regulator
LKGKTLRFFRKSHRGKAAKKEADEDWKQSLSLLKNLVGQKIVQKNLSITNVAGEIGIGHTTLRQYLSSDYQATLTVRLRIEQWIKKNQKD